MNRTRINNCLQKIIVVSAYISLSLFATEPSKKQNPNKVSEFADIDTRIYKEKMLQNFESETFDAIFEPIKTNATAKISDELPPPISTSEHYLGIYVASPETRRVRLEFKNPLTVTEYCRAFNLWINVEKIFAHLTLIVEDREKTRHFLRSELLQFRGWRRLRFPVSQRVRQYDLYLNEKSSLKLIGFEIVFTEKYTKGKLPIILIDEIAAEVRTKYEIPPALRK